jgi:hypothetical protein
MRFPSWNVEGMDGQGGGAKGDPHRPKIALSMMSGICPESRLYIWSVRHRAQHPEPGGCHMESPEQLRVGDVIIRCLDGARFVIRDAQNAGQIQTVQEADIPAIIEFLYQRSPSAQKQLRLERLG